MAWLEKGEYLESPKGQYNRYSWRRWYRRLYLDFSIEPQSKNAMSLADKIKLQREIVSQMELSQITHSRRRAFQGPIAVSFSLSSTSKTPPHIHTAMKNLLDLFGKPLPESGIKRKGLAYYDDKQIKYLSVGYNVTEGEPKIRATIAPLEHFLTDIAFADRILNDEWDLEIDSRSDYNKFLREIGESDEDDYFEDEFDNAYEHFRAVSDKKGAWATVEDERDYKMLLRHAQVDVQKYYLKNYKIRLEEIYHLYRATGLAKSYVSYGDSSFNETMRQHSVAMCKIFEKFSMRINLPGIPKKAGETKAFKEQVREMMQHFAEKRLALAPLQIPIGLEVIFKPPKASEGFSKDLDNIMRLVLPIFHEIFEPPVTPLANVNEDDINSPLLEEIIKGIPKSVRRSVARYDIMEVPRHEGDDDDGCLNLGIFGDIAPSVYSIWNRMDDVIDKWHDEIKDQLDDYGS